jgi:hypothetical protein
LSDQPDHARRIQNGSFAGGQRLKPVLGGPINRFQVDAVEFVPFPLAGLVQSLRWSGDSSIVVNRVNVAKALMTASSAASTALPSETSARSAKHLGFGSPTVRRQHLDSSQQLRLGRPHGIGERAFSPNAITAAGQYDYFPASSAISALALFPTHSSLAGC